MAQTSEGAMKTSAKIAGITYEEYKELVDSGYKRCTRCKQWKPVVAFGKDRTRPDGIDRSCFQCRRVKKRKSLKGRVSTFKGHKHTEAAKQKMRDAANKKDKPPMLGKNHSIESRKKISETRRLRGSALKGPDSPFYKDGKYQERMGVRATNEYKHWRYDVYSRDKFTCQSCGDNRGGNLVTHHIKEFADYPELRFDVNNGLTLCQDCHKKVHYR